MAREQYIVGLDLGTGTIRAVQGKFDLQTGELSVVGAAETPCQGMRRGTIVDIEEVVSSVSQALEKLERMTGVAVASANVSIGGTHITSLSSHGVIAVSRPDGEITEADVIRCIDASQAISIPNNREVLHVFPKTFTLDGQKGIRDPLGMSGIRLEVDTIIVQAGLPYVKNLSKAILQAGVEIEDMVLAPLAAAQGVLTKRQQELGVMVVDLGAGTTNLAVYEEGDLLHTAVLPVGSQHITNDIAIGLRSSIETAEKVKLLYGHTDPKAVSKAEEIDLSKIDASEDQTASRFYVVEIIEARLEEIFSLINGELKKIGRDGKLPAGVVLTGGGSLVPGMVEFAKKELKLPAALGVPHGVSTVIDRVQDPAFATAVGLLMWAQKYGVGSGPAKGLKNIMSNPAFGKLKNWFKSFLP